MFTGVYQSATILAVIVVLYAVDFWLIHRYDPFRTRGSTRNWNYTIKAIVAAAFVIAQPTVWPRLGVYWPGSQRPELWKRKSISFLCP